MTEGERPDVALLASRLRHCALGLASPRQRDLAAAADLADRVATLEREKAVLEDALNDVRDVVEGWTGRRLNYEERNGAIQKIASDAFAALSDSSQGQGE
jgi:hypothetical protein